jgi:glycerol-3-phosphate dehydrogenase
MAGGKLTGYRKMAERAVNVVANLKFSNRNLKGCQTEKVKLSGGDFRNARQVKAYTRLLATQLKKMGLQEFASYLVSNYGRQSGIILERLKKVSQPVTDLEMTKAELWYCIHNEMVVSVLDFFVRRTGMLFFHMDRLPTLIEPIIEEFKKYFDWSDEKISTERLKLEQAVKEATLKN